MLDGHTLPLPWDSGSEPDREYPLRRSPRARRITARVHHDGRAEIVAPLRAPRHAVEDFVRRHRAWIESRQSLAIARRPPPQPFPPPRIEFQAFGETWRLHLSGGDGRLRAHPRPGGWLELSGQAPSRIELAQALRRFLRARVEARVRTWLDQLALEGGFAYAGLSVRLQRTRWGSCSARGHLSINAAIAFQRPEVARYLLCHELAHTRELNHSPRYWRIVEAMCPDWRALDREMTREGWRRVPDWVLGEPR